MNLKIIMAFSVAAILAVFVSASSFATPRWQHVVSSPGIQKNDKTTDLLILGSDKIPRHTDILGDCLALCKWSKQCLCNNKTQWCQRFKPKSRWMACP